MSFLGSFPYTKDGFKFGMGANLWLKSQRTGKPVPVGVLAILDPNDRHHEDYEEGKRYIVTVITADSGEEIEVHESELYTTEQAVLQ